MSTKQTKIWLSFLTVTFVVGLLFNPCAKPILAQQVKPIIELKYSHWEAVKSAHGEVAASWAEEVLKATAGRVKITIYPGGALGKAPEHYDMAVTGVADITFGAHSYTPGRFPLFEVMELPFLTTSSRNGSLMAWDLYTKFPEIQKEHAGVKPLWLNTTGPFRIATAKKPVRTLEDVKGLKLRAAGPLQKDLIGLLGAIPVMIPMPELYESISKGIVDGAILGLSVMDNFRLYNVVKYITLGDFSNITLFIAMNPDSWKRIPAKDQKIIEGLSGKQMAEKAGINYDKYDQLATELSKKAGVEFLTLPAGEMARWKKTLEPLVSSWIAGAERKGLPGKKVYEEAVKQTGR